MADEKLNDRIKEEGWLKDRRGRKRVSLRTKIFLLCVSLVTVTILIFAAMGVGQFIRFAGLISDSAAEQDRVIAENTTDTLRSIETSNFRKYVDANAKVLDGEFRTMKHDMELLATDVKDILEHPERYGEAPLAPPSKVNAGRLAAQLLFSTDADRTDSEMLAKAAKLANLEESMKGIVGISEVMTDCLICLRGGATICVDSHSDQKIDEKGRVMDFNAGRRPYYVGAYLNKNTYFAPVNYDYFNDSLEIMIGVPVYVNGEFAAVCGGSRNLSDMKTMIDKMVLENNTFITLVNETGNIVYSQREGGELAIGDGSRGSVLSSSNTELVDFITGALGGSRDLGRITIDGEPMYLACAPLETVGWSLLIGIPEWAIEEPGKLMVAQMDEISRASIDKTRDMARQAQKLILIIAIALIAIAVISSIRHSGRLVQPIIELRRAGIQFIEREGVELDHAPDYFGRLELYTGDEIEDLWVTMQDLEINIVTSVRSLRRITAEKERIDTELSVATSIQSDMLPKIFPAFPERKEFDLYSSMDPAKEVGGDFYDFFLIDDDHLALVMADVSGKGVPAALFMVISKTIIKNVALSGKYTGPGEILYDVNNKLCESNEEDMFVTVWLGILKISTGRLVSANGGHEYPALCRRGGEYELIRDVHGPGLGMFEDADFEEWEGTLQSGDKLFLYTDGVPEATDANEELFGSDRMLEALNDSRKEKSLEGILRLVRQHVDAFVGNASQFDDLTMTILEYKGNLG